MNKKCAAVILMLTSLLVTGCSGTVMGTDKVTQVAKFVSDGHLGKLTPDIVVETEAIKTAKSFVQLIIDGKYQDAYSSLILPESQFITSAGFEYWLSSQDFTGEFTYTERTNNGIKFVDCSNSKVDLSLQLQPNEDGNKWEILMDDFVSDYFEILTPGEMPLKVDGIDVSGYKNSVNRDNKVVYRIPLITNSPHTITVSTILSDIDVQIQGTGQSVDVTNNLIVTGDMRNSLRTTCATIIDLLNAAMIKDDWLGFGAYFDPSINVSNYSTAFDKGKKTKKPLYYFQCTEVRDLQQSDLDVQFTGYNRIRVHFGTRWKWADPSNVKISKSGKVTVKKYSEMRMENTLELSYIDNKWYVYSIDEDSLVLVSAGLEQWR